MYWKRRRKVLQIDMFVCLLVRKKGDSCLISSMRGDVRRMDGSISCLTTWTCDCALGVRLENGYVYSLISLGFLKTAIKLFLVVLLPSDGYRFDKPGHLATLKKARLYDWLAKTKRVYGVDVQKMNCGKRWRQELCHVILQGENEFTVSWERHLTESSSVVPHLKGFNPNLKFSLRHKRGKTIKEVLSLFH